MFQRIKNYLASLQMNISSCDRGMLNLQHRFTRIENILTQDHTKEELKTIISSINVISKRISNIELELIIQRSPKEGADLEEIHEE